MSSSSEPDFVHPPDDLFIEFSEYFIKKYDIFKAGGSNSDWFDMLSYRLQTQYNCNPTNGVSLLKRFTGIIVVKYLEATKLHTARVNSDDPNWLGDDVIDSSDMDEDLIDKVNMFIQLPFQGNTSDKRLFVDFLNTLLRFMVEYNKPKDRDFQMVEGPVDRKYLLDDKSFAGMLDDGIPEQVKRSNARWYKFNNSDGTRKWRTTADYISELKKIKQHANKIDGSNYNDFNVVGPYGKYGWANSLTKKEADERLQTYRKDGNPDEIVAELGDHIPTRYIPIQDVYDAVLKDDSQRPKSLNSKVTRITNRRFFRTTLYLLEKFIYEIDQGNYGRLDYDEKPYSFILKKTEYLRLFNLDNDFDYNLPDLEYSLSDRAMRYIGAKLEKNEDKNMDKPFYHEYNRVDKSIYRTYYLLSVNMDIYDDIDEIDLLVEGNITKLFNLLNNDIPEYSAIRNELDTEYTKFINNIKNKATILYALKKNTDQLYSPRKYTDIQPDGASPPRSPYSVDGVDGDQVFKQTIKVMELSFFKKLLTKLFNTTDYHEGIKLYPDPNLFKEMFAHYEILKDQLRPAPGNPPYIIMPHLHDERSDRTVESFSIYELQKINERQVYKLFTGFQFDDDLFNRDMNISEDNLVALNKGFIWLNKEIKKNVMEASHLESTIDDKRVAKAILEKQYGMRKYMLEQLTNKHDHIYDILDEPGFEEYASIIHGDADENDNIGQYDFGTIFDMMKSGSLEDYTEDKTVEESLVYLWPERREYRKSILENNPAYVFKKPSDYEEVEDDPFGINQGIDDNLGIRDLLPKRDELDKDQFERLTQWYSPGQSQLTFRNDKDITEELKRKAKEEYRKSYLTINPFVSKMAKKSALMSGIKEKSKQFAQSRDGEEQRRIGKEIMTMNKSLSKMGESLYKKAPIPRKLKDIKSTGGPIFRKWTRTPEEIENLRNKLEKEDYHYVSAYAGSDIEADVIESYEDDVGYIGQNFDIHEEALKSRLIREITIRKGKEQELDDSDLMDEYHKLYELDLPKHIKRKLFTYDIEKLIEIMNKLYSNVLPFLTNTRISKIHKNSIDQKWNVFNDDIAFGSKSDEELKEDAITIIMKIINANENMNPEYKLSDVVSDLDNMEYEMALKEGDELVKDPYGNLVIDHSKKQTTNPLEYPTSVQELLKGRTVIGDRDGAPVHDEYIRYKQPSLEGGGKKKKSRRKTRKKKKRKTIKKKKRTKKK